MTGMKVSFPPTVVIPSTKQVNSVLVDNDSAEILMDSRSRKVFFCSADGEKYLRDLIESFIRGLSTGRNLSLRLDVFDFINETEADLFQNVC